MCATASAFADDRLELDTLEPERVLDFYDSPRIFTVHDRQGRLLLVYQCGEEADTDQFLIVPTSTRQLDDLEQNRVTLRDALTSQGCAWLIGEDRAGHILSVNLVDPVTLPKNALPEPGAFLRAR